MSEPVTDPNMPKVIPSVWISLVVALLGTATAFGAPISEAQSAALIALAGALAAVIPTLDVILRRGRLAYLAQKEQAVARAAAENRLRARLAPVATTIVNNQPTESPE